MIAAYDRGYSDALQGRMCCSPYHSPVKRRDYNLGYEAGKRAGGQSIRARAS